MRFMIIVTHWMKMIILYLYNYYIILMYIYIIFFFLCNKSRGKTCVRVIHLSLIVFVSCCFFGYDWTFL